MTSGTTDRGDPRAYWNGRSRIWASTTSQGRSQDDTFNQMIIAGAGIKPGEDILDIASGSGNPAVSVALSMSGRGSVTCLDQSPGMLQAAHARADHLDLAIMRFVAGEMTALPFFDGCFDCITCRFGIMFPKDKVKAAAEALRVLRRGGRAAWLVWGPYEENPAFFVPRRTVAAFFGEEEGPVPARHGMSAPGTLTAVLDAAGFLRAEERELRYRNPVTDLDAYVANGLKRSFASKVDGLRAAEFERLKQALIDAWAPYKEGGVTPVPNFARLGIGWKAA